MEFHQNITDGLLFHNIRIQVIEKDSNSFGQFIHKDTKSPLCCHIVPLHEMIIYLTKQRKIGHWICKNCDPHFVHLLGIRVPNVKHIRPILEFTKVFKNRSLGMKDHFGYELIQGKPGEKRKLESEENGDSYNKKMRNTSKDEEEDRTAIETLVSNIDSDPVSFLQDHFLTKEFLSAHPDMPKDSSYGTGLIDEEREKLNALRQQRRNKIPKDDRSYIHDRTLSFIAEERKELKAFDDEVEDITDLANDLDLKIVLSNTQMSTILEDNNPAECNASFYNSLLDMPMMWLLGFPRTNNIKVDCSMVLTALYPYFFPPSIRKYYHLKNLINTRSDKIVSDTRLLYALQSPEMEYMVYRTYMKIDPPLLIKYRQNMQGSIYTLDHHHHGLDAFTRIPKYIFHTSAFNDDDDDDYSEDSMVSIDSKSHNYTVDFHGDALYYAPKAFNNIVLHKWEDYVNECNKLKEQELKEKLDKDPSYITSLDVEEERDRVIIAETNRALYNWYKEFAYIYERSKEIVTEKNGVLQIRKYKDSRDKQGTVFDIRLSRTNDEIQLGHNNVPEIDRIGYHATRNMRTLSIPIHNINYTTCDILKIDLRLPNEDSRFEEMFLTFPKDQFDDASVHRALLNKDIIESLIKKKALQNSFKSIKELCLIGMRNTDLTNHGLDQIRKFENLESLSLIDTCIITIPPYLRDMRSLKNLHIECGLEDRINRFMGNDIYGLLPNIDTIILACVKNASLIHHLMPLHDATSAKLKTLVLRKNSKSVFMIYSNMRNYEFDQTQTTRLHNDAPDLLTLKRNILMRWNSIANVTTLSLVDCDLDFIPYVVGTLKNLIHLDLSGNKIQTWVEIVNARHADKGGMYIGFFRHNLNVISELTKLETLNLSDNDLKVMPFGLLTISDHIKRIDLKRNPINISNLGDPRHKYFNRDVVKLLANDKERRFRFKFDQSIYDIARQLYGQQYDPLFKAAVSGTMNLLKQIDVKDIRELLSQILSFSRLDIEITQDTYKYTRNMQINKGGEQSVDIDNLPNAMRKRFLHLIGYGSEEDDPVFQSIFSRLGNYVSDQKPPNTSFSIFHTNEGMRDMESDRRFIYGPMYDTESNPMNFEIQLINSSGDLRRGEVYDKLLQDAGYSDNRNSMELERNPTIKKRFYNTLFESDIPVLSSRVQGEIAFERMNVKRYVDIITNFSYSKEYMLRYC